jgi:serine beta-lactamase-like protein LACTB, mitochondrial
MSERALRLKPSAILTLVLAVGALAAAHQQTGSAVPASSVARIEVAVTAFMGRVNAPGLSLAIGVDGRVQFENGYGLADVENFVPAKASTVYRLASVSKPITAVATMQLVERHRLTLEDTVGQWLPDAPAPLRPITVRQLLSHQSGIRHYTPQEDDSSKHYPQHYVTLRDALAIFKNDPLVHAPGAQMTYTTYGYTLLGVIIEEASGQNYVDFVTENIFKPLEMMHSRPDTPHTIVPNRSRGYAKTDAGVLRNAGFMDPSYKIPGGGWLSTGGDMVRFGLALQAGMLLKRETFQQMTTMQRVGGKEDTFYGLGWIVEGWGVPDAPRVPGLVWHGGVQQGVTTNLYLLLPDHTVVAVMTNLEGEGLALTKLASEITNIVLGR